MSVIIPIEEIQQRVSIIRGHRVMIDADLAVLYSVTTRPDTELLPLINPAELASVPRTVTRNPQKQAPCLARRADRAEFETIVFLFWIHGAYLHFFICFIIQVLVWSNYL